MLRPATLIGTLAAFAVRGLSAQAPTDLAGVCHAVGEATLGQWASFDATGKSDAGKLRLAVVGTERSGDTTLNWFELNLAAKDPKHSGVIQILAPSLAAGTAAAHSVIVKWGAQPAVKVSGQMAAMMGEKGGQNNSVFDWAARCTSAHVVGWESVTVPAGTMRALHVTTDDGTDVWASRDVQFGLVKLRGKDGELALAARGADAKSSITEEPLELPGMMMTKP
jgi:hypothetical protein